MKIQYSIWQTQRRCYPDKEELNCMILIKGCKHLNLTYQIYSLGEEAERLQKRFILRVIRTCKISPELHQFIKEHKRTRLERF